MIDLYRKIYSPEGTMFEVPPEKAADLILNKGWSNTPPASEKLTKKASKKAKDEKTVPVADTTEAYETDEYPLTSSE